MSPGLAMRHLTLSTGHVRESSRSEVDDEALSLLAAPLRRYARGGGRWQVPGPPGLTAQTTAEGSALLVTLCGSGGPLVTLGVAPDLAASARLWPLLARMSGNAVLPRHQDAAPMAPWCAVVLQPGIALHPEHVPLLGDLERCLAWAWLRVLEEMTEAGE